MRRPPAFPYSMWGMFDRVVEELPRTNNNVEGWHSAFAAHANGSHLSLWRFIEALHREANIAAVSMTHAAQGREPPKQHPRYKAVDIRIRAVVADYPNRDTMAYLRALAMNFRY